MKKLVFISVIVFLSIHITTAQERKHRENFKAYKIAYITQQLDLSPDEAEKFWPVYNEYVKKSMNLRAQSHKIIRKQLNENGGIETLNDIEVNEYLTSLLQNEKKNFDIKNQFYANLKPILPAKKILLLYRTEGDFNRKVLSEFRKKKHINTAETKS